MRVADHQIPDFADLRTDKRLEVGIVGKPSVNVDAFFAQLIFQLGGFPQPRGRPWRVAFQSLDVLRHELDWRFRNSDGHPSTICVCVILLRHDVGRLHPSAPGFACSPRLHIQILDLDHETVHDEITIILPTHFVNFLGNAIDGLLGRLEEFRTEHLARVLLVGFAKHDH